MNPHWPTVPLGEVLTKSDEWINLNPDETYRQVTVKLWGKGVVLRGEITGAEIAASKQCLVHARQFIASRIDARNGAFGLIPDSLEGAIVTSDFPVFSLNETRMLPEYLHWLSKTGSFVELCKAASEGTTNRVRLKEDRFLALEIPLPAVTEQRRIVARIEQLAAQIEAARRLRHQATEESEVLPARAASHALDDAGWELQALEDLLAEPPRNGLGPQKQVESGGRTMLRINAVSSAPTRFVDLTASKMVDVADALAEPFVLRNDDVFIVRYNGDLNRVAKAAIFKGKTDIIYPDKLIRLRPDPKKMLPDFLVYALGSRSVRAQIEDLGKTTAGQIGVSGADAKSFRVPVPPVAEQRRLVAYLDGLAGQVARLQRLQTETAEELDALLPSILDKAFKGEL